MLVEKPTGTIRTAYDPNGDPYLLDATGTEAKRFIDILNADEEGRLLLLPCKVGDTLYEPTNSGTISSYLVRGFRIEPFDSIWVEWDILDGFVYRYISGVNADEIGKTVFLTREEAEKALEEINNDER